MMRVPFGCRITKSPVYLDPRNTLRRRRATAAETLESRVLLAAFTVTTTADDGPGSLRQAVIDANASPGADTITVAAAASGGVVQLQSPLPVLTGQTMISGPLEVLGDQAGPGARGLVFEPGATGSSVSNLVLFLFGGAGMIVNGANVSVRSSEILASGDTAPDSADKTGLLAVGGASVEVEDSRFRGNLGVGVLADGSGTSIRLTGVTVFSNESHGVAITGGASGQILGFRNPNPLLPSVINSISGNLGSGLYVRGAVASPVTGTAVHVRAADLADNVGDGITIVDSSGVRAEGGVANAVTTSFNRNGGVVILGASRGNEVGGVAGWLNSGPGIDLNGDDLTINDPLDADAGPNDLLNRPLLTSATRDGSVITVSGTMATTPNTRVKLHFFLSDPTVSESGAEGERWAHEAEVTTDAAGHADVRVQIPGATESSLGQLVTATATAVAPGLVPPEALSYPENSSEYSNQVPVRAGGMPTVQKVFVAGSRWNGGFLEAMEGPGYDVSYGDGEAPVPWTNLDTIIVQFDKPVHVESDDLSVVGLAGTAYDIAAFDYYPETETATWKLTRPVGFDRLRIELDADAGGITSGAGDLALDGDRDGTPGGDYRSRLTVWPGDVDRSRRVNSLDLAAVRSKLNSGLVNGRPAGTYTLFHDVDGSGRIDALDLAAMRRAIATQPGFPTPEPITAALFGGRRIE